jgi:nickel-dependent lactate racemase
MLEGENLVISCRVPNGKQTIAFSLPAGTEIAVVATNPLPLLPDPAEAIRRAILDPIGSPRLSERVKPGQKVALIATDVTRKLPEEIILPILIEELQKGGVRGEDITIVVATGTHRPNTPEEFVAMYGEAVCSRIRVVNHDPWDPAGLVDLGKSKNGIPLVVNRVVAEADVRISTGVIETHLFAGYSGGVKSIAVGVAGEATIAATHNYGMMKDTRLGATENNPFRDFLTEAAMAVGLDFIVNVVQTGDKGLVRVVAGDPVAAFREGVRTARAMVEVEIVRPGDIVVAGVSYPKNRDLYQATRAANSLFFGPRPVVAKGGSILIPASCEDGFGHPGYVDWMRRCDSPAAVIRYACDFGFAPGDQKALILGRILEHARIVVTDCRIDPAELRAIHLETAPTLQEALNEELRRRPDARVIVIPDALLALPVVRGG